MRNIFLSSLVASVVYLWCVPSLLAASYLYNLNNHPDGNAADPTYGFRLDDLVDVNAGKDIWTFDFNHTLSSMFLDYDNSNTAPFGDDTVHIFGTAFGGLDINSSYDANERYTWEIDFTYSANIQRGGPPGTDISDVDIFIDPSSPGLNNGFITVQTLEGVAGSLNVGDMFYLQDFEGCPDCKFSFAFNNTDQHRLTLPTGGDADYGLPADTFVGWGWVNHGSETPPANTTHIAASDWLFIATPVPEPSTMLLLSSGLAGLFAWRLRKVYTS